MNRKLGIAAAGLIAFAALAAPATPSTASRQKTNLRQETQALVRTGIPGAVLVTKQPGEATRIAAGTDLSTTRRPMLTGDRFRVGSITKTFVATLVLQLAAEHRLALDDTVERWLPGLVPSGDAITLRQLLRHVLVDPFVRDRFANQILPPRRRRARNANRDPHFEQ